MSKPFDQFCMALKCLWELKDGLFQDKTHILFPNRDEPEVRTYSWQSELRLDFKFYLELLIHALFPNWMLYYNHFYLTYYGYSPVAIVDSYYFERTFLFHTKEEAERAAQELETEERKVIGWWYEVNEFKTLVEEDDRYKKEDLKIEWFNIPLKEKFYK